MKCKNCGKEFVEGKFCLECGAKYEVESKMKESIEKACPTEKKEYSFSSSFFMCLRLIYRGVIYSSVIIEDDMMKISIDPKRLNKISEVCLSEVISVKTGFAISNYLLYGAIFIALVGMFSDTIGYVFAALVVFWLGIVKVVIFFLTGPKKVAFVFPVILYFIFLTIMVSPMGGIFI